MFDGAISSVATGRFTGPIEQPHSRSDIEWRTAPADVRDDLSDAVAEHTGERPAARYRTIWISDIHLGTVGCQSDALLEFLRCTESDSLYLVGDIIDGWALKRRWYWDQSHNDIVQKVLRKARKGTRVTFVAGNHDEAARQFLGLSFGGITIADEVIHRTAAGKLLLVIHGDQFDGVIQCAKWLAHLGDNAYEFSLKLSRVLNSVRRYLGLPYWSLSQYLKHRVKNAVSYITAFEEAVANAARRRGLDGVVCGHIHRPEMRDIDGVLYCNDGDWVESLSALVENFGGTLHIVTWPHPAMSASASTIEAARKTTANHVTEAA